MPDSPVPPPTSTPTAAPNPTQHWLRAGDRLTIDNINAVVINCLEPESGMTDSIVVRIESKPHPSYVTLHRHVRYSNGNKSIYWFVNDDSWPTKYAIEVVYRKFVADRRWS